MQTSPFMETGERVQAFLLDQLLPLAIRGLLTLFVLAVAVTVVVIVVQRWRFRDNPAAGALHVKRRRVAEEFGLTIRRVRPDGRVRIAPGESARWLRDGLEDEMQNFLGKKISLAVKKGYAWIKTPYELPEQIEGEPTFAHGDVYIGQRLSDGGLAYVEMRQVSTVLVGGRPGSGKSVLLQNLLDAFGEECMVHYFDGKVQAPEHAMDTLVGIQEVMEERLRLGIDWWKNPEHYSLVIFVVDECQRLFSADSSDKAEKQAVADRTRIVRDIAQRGRSAGVMLVLASQRLSADVVPTSIRDLAGVRFVGRCTRGEDVEMILGRRTTPDEPDPTTFRTGQFLAEDSAGNLIALQCFAR